MKQYDLAYLFSLVTKNKAEKIKQVIKNRTTYITVVLENIAQQHNASAVLRSCDVFGIQDVHVIESKRKFIPEDGIAKGATKWLNINYYKTTQECADALKKQGYTLVATTPHSKGYTLQEFPIKNKIALMFGTEISGLSAQALSLADECVTIPMVGFTESFNVSVSTAICLYAFTTKLHASDINWRMAPDQAQEVQRVWLERILHMADRS